MATKGCFERNKRRDGSIRGRTIQQLIFRLGMPFDMIIASSIIGTEIGGLPGSKVVELRREPRQGEPDAALIVVDVPEVIVEYHSGA